MATADVGPKVNIVIWIVTIVPLLIVLLRIYCKRSTTGRRLGADDWIVVSAEIILLIYAVLITLAIKHGIGRHLVDLIHAPPPVNVTLALEYVVVGEVILIIGCSLSKTSFAFTLLRIVTQRYLKIILWFIIISMNIIMLLCALFYIVRCDRVEANWNAAIPAKCWPIEVSNYFSVFAGIYSGLVDLTLAFLPWMIIMKLQMRRREKLGICLAMSLGVFAAVSAFVKTSYLPALNEVTDITYVAGNLLMWAPTETGVTIVAVSVPSLRTLVKGWSTRKTTRQQEEHQLGTKQDNQSDKGILRTSEFVVFYGDNESALAVGSGHNVNDEC